MLSSELEELERGAAVVAAADFKHDAAAVAVEERDLVFGRDEVFNLDLELVAAAVEDRGRVRGHVEEALGHVEVDRDLELVAAAVGDQDRIRGHVEEGLGNVEIGCDLELVPAAVEDQDRVRGHVVEAPGNVEIGRDLELVADVSSARPARWQGGDAGRVGQDVGHQDRRDEFGHDLRAGCGMGFSRDEMSSGRRRTLRRVFDPSGHKTIGRAALFLFGPGGVLDLCARVAQEAEHQTFVARVRFRHLCARE